MQFKMNHENIFSLENIKLANQLLLRTLTYAHYLLELSPIFDRSKHNFGKRYEDNLRIIFNQ